MIIGLLARARHGKDTVADYLVEKYGFKKVAFAQPLKQMLIDEGICTYEECYINKTERSREWMQKVGELFRKYVSEEYFIDALISKLCADGTERTVICDMRFPNEMNRIKSWASDSIVVKIKRTNEDDTPYRAENMNHDAESEKHVDGTPCDFVIEAKSGGVEKLKNDIDMVLVSMLKMVKR